jgi:hypothetical protein
MVIFITHLLIDREPTIDEAKAAFRTAYLAWSTRAG